MIEVINVSSKGQIVIPERIRAELEIKEGSRLVLIERAGTILLKKEESISKQLEEMEKREEKGWAMLAEKSLYEVWDNPKDEAHWKKYLKKNKTNKK